MFISQALVLMVEDSTQSLLQISRLIYPALKLNIKLIKLKEEEEGGGVEVVAAQDWLDH